MHAQSRAIVVISLLGPALALFFFLSNQVALRRPVPSVPNSMTESEWLSSADPERMWVSLDDDQKNSRKLALWGCACLRRIWPMLTDERCRNAVEVAERGDGSIDENQFFVVYDAALKGWGAQADEAADANYSSPLHRAMSDAGLAAWHCIDGDWQCAGNAADAVANFAGPEGDPAWKRARDQEARAQADLLRDVFGNPFRPIQFASAWKTSEVVQLAQSIYDEKSFERMPELADALENAGCTNAEVLEHCRRDGPHTRGCWVVDLVLGKK